MKMIRVSDGTHKRIQLLAAVRNIRMSQVVDRGISATMTADEYDAMCALLATQDAHHPITFEVSAATDDGAEDDE